MSTDKLAIPEQLQPDDHSDGVDKCGRPDLHSIPPALLRLLAREEDAPTLSECLSVRCRPRNAGEKHRNLHRPRDMLTDDSWVSSSLWRPTPSSALTPSRRTTCTRAGRARSPARAYSSEAGEP